MYENKFIKVKDFTIGEFATDEGIVIGCDIEKGITIISAKDPNRILFCISNKNEINKRGYLAKYEIIENQIKNGCLLPNEFFNELDKRNLGEQHIGRTQEEFTSICPFKN